MLVSSKFIADLCPKCAAYYGNRSAAYVMLKNYDNALRDARTSVEVDPTFIKVCSGITFQPRALQIYSNLLQKNLETHSLNIKSDMLSNPSHLRFKLHAAYDYKMDYCYFLYKHVNI